MKFAAAAKVIGSPIRGDDKYYGDVSDADGKNVIGIPYESCYFGNFDVKKQQWKEIGSDLGDHYGKYSGGIIAKDGNLYCVPFCANRIAKLNIESQEISFVGDSYDGLEKWDGCVMGNDDNIYFIPCCHSHVMKLDVKSGETFPIGDEFEGGDRKWSGGAVGSDGCLYFVPFDGKRVLRVDVVNGTTTMIGDSYDGDGKWIGCIAGRKKHILYCCPCNANQILMININYQTTSLIGQDLGNSYWKWSGFVKDHNNYIYGIPCGCNYVLFFNLKYNLTSLIGDDLGNKREKWCGGALTEDESIHSMPSLAEKVLKITPFLTRWKTTVLSDIVQCNQNNASFINILAIKVEVDDEVYCVNESLSAWKSFEEWIENANHPLSNAIIHTGIISIQHLQRCINRMKDDEYLILTMYPTISEKEIKEMIDDNDHILWSCHDLFIEDDEEHRRMRFINTEVWDSD